jgi:hypothetical protein
VNIQSNAVLKAVTLSKLQSLKGSYGVFVAENEALETLSFPKLCKFHETLIFKPTFISNNDNLSEVIFGAIPKEKQNCLVSTNLLDVHLTKDPKRIIFQEEYLSMLRSAAFRVVLANGRNASSTTFDIQSCIRKTIIT